MAELTISLPKDMKADGERFLPGVMHGGIELEHMHRYYFAGRLVAGKVVLDIASGEGYGSAFLAQSADRVIGVDISMDAVAHASAKYSRENLEYLVGTCSGIPLADGSVDVVVSFETIEHHDEHEAMMREIKRVLRPGGILVISSPDKHEYSEKAGFRNPFHARELYFEEFQSLLDAHFKKVRLYGQRVVLGSALLHKGRTEKLVFLELDNAKNAAPNLPMPLYWIAVASDEKLPSTSGGVLEQPLAKLWQDITSQRNAKIVELIQAVAEPDSNLLKAQLSGSWYLQQNPDIVEVGVDPYEHWLNSGMSEGRLPASDPVVLARDLVSEREQSLRVAIEEKEREFRQVQHESDERQRVLEAAIAQTRLKARYEVDAQLRTLAERERAFAEQLAQLKQAASQERAAQMEAAQQQMSALAEQHTQREQSLRVAIEKKEREFRQVQHESLERQQVLEAAIAQTKLKARDEVAAQLCTLAERERAFAEQLSQLQQAAGQERAAQMEATQRQISVLAEQHAQREQSLRGAIEEKERELRQSQHEFFERQRVLEAAIAQTKLKARDDVDAQLRTLAKRERAFAEQLAQLQQAAREERTFLQDQYSRVLVGLNNRLGAIQSTWSWRLTTPLRSFSALFGIESDFSPIDPRQLSSVLVSKEQENLAKHYPEIDASKYLASIAMGKDKQEIPTTNSSLETVSPVKTLDELLAYDGEAFVTCAYLTLLGRLPDPQGFSYYLERLRKIGDKLTILYQLYRSQEAKKFNSNIAGLKAAVKRQRWQKFPVIGALFRRRMGYLQDQMLRVLREINGRISSLETSFAHSFNEVQQSAPTAFKPIVDRQIDALFKTFDGQKYLKAHSDVAAAGLNPYEHWIRAGFSEGRWPSPGSAPVEKVQPLTNPAQVEVLAVPEHEPLIYSEPPLNPKVKLIAFYLPQFHPTPENDKWWGKGFTEWTNITRARPFYVGHEQPRLPGELGFYDLRLVEVMRRQAELAKIHGFFGFCFYIYWFAGRRLLETPINLFLNNPDIDIKFCYCWANENWTRRWDGLEDDILIAQSHSPEDDIAFIEYIALAFKDKRYIKVDNRPLLILYRPGLLPDCKQTVKRWRKWCRENGIGELYVACTESFGESDPREFGMDASIQFPPRTNGPHKEITTECRILETNFMGKVYDYTYTVNNASDYIRPSWTQYRSVMSSWDNTARRMERAFSFKGATPDLYKKWLNDVSVESVKHFGSADGLVFVNAWNEWAECAYLEPDKLRGYAYLNRTREVVSKFSTPVAIDSELFDVKARGHDVALVVHLYYLELFDVISNYLDNVCEIADMYFSVREGAHNIASEKIKERYPHAVVVSYPNHGRDVLPFLKIFRHLRDLKYNAICKIHTKMSKHRHDGEVWRDNVLNKLLGSEEIVNGCLNKINLGAGVIAPAGHLLDSSSFWGSNAEKVTRLAKEMGCPQAWIEHFCFPAGTMFWCAPNALQPLLALGLNEDDFETEEGQVDGTTAHAVERLIALSTLKAGLSIVETADGLTWDGGAYPFAAKG